jgi:hypothetical protein
MMPSTASIQLIAQTDTAGIASIIVWSGALIVLVILAFLAYAAFKRWMKEPAVSSGGGGFTLSDLRELHRQGKMTTEEYELARAKMVASAKKMADAMPDPLAGRAKPIAPAKPASEPPGSQNS